MRNTVAISIPSAGDWKTGFAMSLIRLLCPSKPNASEGLGVIVQMESSSSLLANRHRLVRAAQKGGFSHILWLDDDMVFPEDTLCRLLAHGKPIVAANCTSRKLPVIPMAVKGNSRISSRGKTGLFEVDHIGMAVMLTETRVFDAFPAPWFQFEWDTQNPDTYMSEDYYFCREAKKAGFPILIDHGLSNEIGHVGDVEFVHAMVRER